MRTELRVFNIRGIYQIISNWLDCFICVVDEFPSIFWADFQNLSIGTSTKGLFREFVFTMTKTQVSDKGIATVSCVKLTLWSPLLLKWRRHSWSQKYIWKNNIPLSGFYKNKTHYIELNLNVIHLVMYKSCETLWSFLLLYKFYSCITDPFICRKIILTNHHYNALKISIYMSKTKHVYNKTKKSLSVKYFLSEWTLPHNATPFN